MLTVLLVNSFVLRSQTTIVKNESFNDTFSNENYQNMVASFAQLAAQAKLSRNSTAAMKESLVKVNDDILNIGDDFLAKRNLFKDFFSVTSMDFIDYKYDTKYLNPVSPLFAFARSKTSWLHKQINHESERVSDYLNEENPISEGKRVYLVLSAIEQTLNICTEDDTH